MDLILRNVPVHKNDLLYMNIKMGVNHHLVFSIEASVIEMKLHDDVGHVHGFFFAEYLNLKRQVVESLGKL